MENVALLFQESSENLFKWFFVGKHYLTLGADGQHRSLIKSEI